MFKYFNSINIKKSKPKHILISLLVLTSLFLAFNHHPSIVSRWEGVEIYKSFLPTKNPPLVLTISEDSVLFGLLNTFGYASLLMVSRYISDCMEYTE